MNMVLLNEMIEKTILEQVSEDELLKEVKRLLKLYCIADKNLEYYDSDNRGTMKSSNRWKKAAAERLYNRASKMFNSFYGSSHDTSMKFVALHREILKQIKPDYGSY